MRFTDKYLYGSLLLFIVLGCSSNYGKYLKNKTLEESINKTIETILDKQPYANNVTVYFTHSEEDGYFLFVTDHIGTYGYRSKYYFELYGKQVIVGYKNRKIEKLFANPAALKPELFFEDPGELSTYSSKQVVYRINSDLTFEILPNPGQEIWELNDFMEFTPLPEPPPEV